MVKFLAMLQAANRIQVPVEVRWRFKLKAGELLHVSIGHADGFGVRPFYAKLQKGGRFTVPWEVVEDLGLSPGDRVTATLSLEPK